MRRLGSFAYRLRRPRGGGQRASPPAARPCYLRDASPGPSISGARDNYAPPAVWRPARTDSASKFGSVVSLLVFWRAIGVAPSGALGLRPTCWRHVARHHILPVRLGHGAGVLSSIMLVDMCGLAPPETLVSACGNSGRRHFFHAISVFRAVCFAHLDLRGLCPCMRGGLEAWPGRRGQRPSEASVFVEGQVLVQAPSSAPGACAMNDCSSLRNACPLWIAQQAGESSLRRLGLALVSQVVVLS